MKLGDCPVGSKFKMPTVGNAEGRAFVLVEKAGSVMGATDDRGEEWLIPASQEVELIEV